VYSPFVHAEGFPHFSEALLYPRIITGSWSSVIQPLRCFSRGDGAIPSSVPPEMFCWSGAKLWSHHTCRPFVVPSPFYWPVSFFSSKERLKFRQKLVEIYLPFEEAKVGTFSASLSFPLRSRSLSIFSSAESGRQDRFLAPVADLSLSTQVRSYSGDASHLFLSLEMLPSCASASDPTPTSRLRPL